MENGAYVLIGTVVGKSVDVSQALHRRDWVETLERTVEEYDIMVVARREVGPITEGMAAT